MNLAIKLPLFFLFFFLVLNPERLEGQTKAEDQKKKNQLDSEGYFIDALKAEILEKPQDAIKLFEKSLEIQPDNAAAHFKIAEIQVRQSEKSEALIHSKKATKLDPSNYYYWLQYAALQEDQSDWKGAIKSYTYVVDHFPSQQEARLSMVQIYIKNKKFKEAEKEFERAQAALGPLSELFLLRQNLFSQQNDIEKALKVGKEWMEALPDEVEGYYSQVQILTNNRRVEEAIALLAKMKEKFPSNPTSFLMLADIYLNQKEEEKAEKEMLKAFSSPDLPIEAKIQILSGYLRIMDSEEEKNKALNLANKIIDIHPGDSKSYIVKGDILNKSGDKTGARSLYLKAARLDKSNFGLWEQTVLIDLNLNEIDSLVIHTMIAKELFPNTPSFAFYNGLGNLMKKNYSVAVESLEQARRISLDNKEMQFEIYSQLGDAYYNLKEKNKAFESFDAALQLDSGSSHVLNNYSYFLSLDKTMMDKALRMSQKLIQLFPEDPTFLDTRGWVLYQAGLFAEALGPLEKAANASKSGVVWEHFGDVLYQVGRINEALLAWKKAFELGGEVSGNLERKVKEKKIN